MSNFPVSDPRSELHREILENKPMKRKKEKDDFAFQNAHWLHALIAGTSVYFSLPFLGRIDPKMNIMTSSAVTVGAFAYMKTIGHKLPWTP